MKMTVASLEDIANKLSEQSDSSSDSSDDEGNGEKEKKKENIPPKEDTNNNKNDSTVKTSYKCEHCNFNTDVKYYLDKHVKFLHRKTTFYLCNFCEYASDNLYSIEKHASVHYNEIPEHLILDKSIKHYKQSTYDKASLKDLHRIMRGESEIGLTELNVPKSDSSNTKTLEDATKKPQGTEEKPVGTEEKQEGTNEKMQVDFKSPEKPKRTNFAGMIDESEQNVEKIESSFEDMLKKNSYQNLSQNVKSNHDKSDLNKLKNILTSVMKHSMAWPFNSPVNVKALKLNDYYDIIKNPMDFGTVRSRLDRDYYSEYSQALADIRLVFSNCYLYNKPEEEVVGMAKELDYFFESKLENTNLGKKALDGSMLKRLKTLLRQVMNHKFGWPFNEPVDVKGLKLFDYYHVVTFPMDFGTIKTRLDKNNYYEYFEDVIQDMKLVFFNCYLYNKKGTDVRTMAEVLEKFFEEKLSGMSNKGGNTKRRFSEEVIELDGTITSIKKEKKENINTVNRKGDPDKKLIKQNEELEHIHDLLKKVMKHKASWPFNSPVDVELLQLDDYFDVVKHPMDFGTIESRLNKNHYTKLDSVVSDVRLVFSNCYLYNDTEDEVVAMADEVERFFENNLEKITATKKSSESDSQPSNSKEPGIPSVKSEALPSSSEDNKEKDESTSKIDKSESLPEPESQNSNFEKPVVNPVKSETRPLSSKAIKESDVSTSKEDSDSDDEERKKKNVGLHRIRVVLKKVMKHKKAWPFNAPVDAKLLKLRDYHDVVKRPMDFGTIEMRLNENHYKNLESVVNDIRLVFSNCYLYNDTEDEIVEMAEEVERYFQDNLASIACKKFSEKSSQRRNSEESGFFSSDAETFPSSKKNMKEKNAPTFDDSSDSDDEEDPRNVGLDRIRGVLKLVMKHKMAWPFNFPVDVKLLKLDDYYDVIKKPMDFGTIEMKLNANNYRSLESVVSDIRLVFSNCYLYNEKDDEIVEMAEEVERYFEDILTTIADKNFQKKIHSLDT